MMDRKQCFIFVLGQNVEMFKTRVLVRALPDGDRPALPGDPAGDTFSGFEDDLSQFLLMRGLGGHQGEPGAVLVEEVNEDRVRAGHVVDRLDDLAQSEGEIKRRVGDLDDLAQNFKFPDGADIELLVDCLGHTGGYCNTKIPSTNGKFRERLRQRSPFRLTAKVTAIS